MEKNRIDVITLGCSKNLVDSEQLMAQFEAIGYKVKHDPEQITAQTVIVNTCGFIGDAKQESVEMILDLAQAKQNGEIKQLIVMGCLSERYLADLESELPEVDAFFGKFDWTEVIKYLGQEYRPELHLQRKLTTPSHYAYVKIAEGCNRICSYCAIPIITGKYKSRPLDDIIQEVEILVSKGVKEVQLIAQDLTFYGYDIYKKNRLAELVDSLAKMQGLKWLRLHYAYPTQFPIELLAVMRENKNVCAYLDIALQHISDNMLSLMRRNITKQATYELIQKMRAEVPNLHLRTTLLVGHPGETQQDFEELKQFVRDIKFERLGSFAYSNEEGTYAYNTYNDDIPQHIKQQRVDEIMAIQEEIAAEINAQKVDKIMTVIIDHEEDEYYIGRTEFDSPEVDGEVLIDKSIAEMSIGEFYEVKITAADTFDLYASPVLFEN